MRLEGKVALISGGARGQGAVEARLFAQEGAKVVIADILDEQGKQVEAEIAEAGGDATYVHLDVPSGVLSSVLLRPSGVDHPSSVILVFMGPGCTELTLIPSLAY